MSLVVFPFKSEDLAVVSSNLATAARHDRIGEVWAVASAEGSSMSEVASAAASIAAGIGTPISVFAQERLGRFRSGKGDGMNTAIRLAAERGFDRTHFFDADITNFDGSWIDGAEDAADRGFGVVRHRFPRAATDAMITWMVTRPGLAILFPDSPLPDLGQPLGGEMLLSSEAVARLASDPLVVARSDWGVDTVITYATTVMELGTYEHNAADGKRHALYGSLSEIKEMFLECLDAVASLAGRPPPPADTLFAADPPAEVPADLKTTVGYDLEATRRSIAEQPDDAEREVLARLGVDADGTSIMDGRAWGRVFPRLLAEFELGSEPWRAAAFRLWVKRVIDYTTNQVPLGYDHAIAYLESTIDGLRPSRPRSTPTPPPRLRDRRPGGAADIRS